MENQFPGNSNLPGPKGADKEPKKVEKVVAGKVVQRKKPLSRKFKEFFFNGEDTKSVIKHVFTEVIIPGAKDTIYDAADQTLQRKLFGEARGRRARGGFVGGGGIFGNATYNAYNRYAGNNQTSLRPDPRQQQQMNPRGRAQQRDLAEIILESRGEATEVLDQMIAIADQYGTVSVSDLWELLGVTGEHTDNKWGWTDLMGTDIQRVTEGGTSMYLLALPAPQALDR